MTIRINAYEIIFVFCFSIPLFVVFFFFFFLHKMFSIKRCVVYFFLIFKANAKIRILIESQRYSVIDLIFRLSELCRNRDRVRMDTFSKMWWLVCWLSPDGDGGYRGIKLQRIQELQRKKWKTHKWNQIEWFKNVVYFRHWRWYDAFCYAWIPCYRNKVVWLVCCCRLKSPFRTAAAIVYFFTS